MRQGRKQCQENRTVATLGDIPGIKETLQVPPQEGLGGRAPTPKGGARKGGDAAVHTLASMVGEMFTGAALGQDTANKVESKPAKVESKPAKVESKPAKVESKAAKVESKAAKVRKCSVCAQPGHNKRTCPEAAPAPKTAAPVPRRYGVLDGTFNKVLDLVEALPREEQAAFRGQLESLDDEAKVCGEWYLHPESIMVRVLGSGPGANLLVGLILPYLKERGLL